MGRWAWDQMAKVGLEDALVAGGLLLLGLALWLAFGWPELLAYVGVVMVAAGATITWSKSRGQ